MTSSDASHLSAEQLQEIGKSCFCLQSRMTARVLTRQYNAILAPRGLEITEFSLLIAIKQGIDSSITDLAERMAFERSTLVRSLKRIVDRGLVKNDKGTGRAVRYILTKEGERILTKVLPLWLDAQASVRQNISAEASPEQVLHNLKVLREVSL